MRKIARFAVLSLLVAAAAHADIIYDNGGTLLEGGLLSNEAVGFIVTDNFVLEEGANVLADVHWWGHYFHTDALPDDFTIYILADAGDSPGDDLHTFTDPVIRTDTGDDTFGVFSEYEYHMDITPVEMTAGTTYWIAIQNNIPNCDWYWSISDFAEGDTHQKLTAWEKPGSRDGVLPHGQRHGRNHSRTGNAFTHGHRSRRPDHAAEVCHELMNVDKRFWRSQRPGERRAAHSFS